MTHQGIIITGASRGLGAALAQAYAAPGIALGLIARDATALDAVAEACRQRGATVRTATVDVTDAATLAATLAAFDAETPTNILIANAGIALGPPARDIPEDAATIARVVAVNLLGVTNTVAALLPAMTARRTGRIALIGSVAALRGLPDSPAYCASKAGVRLYGESLRAQLRPSGVGVTIVLPGFFASAMSARFQGPRLGILPAEKMAQAILRAIAANRPRLTIPLALGILLRVLDLLPAPLSDRLIRLYRFQIADNPG